MKREIAIDAANIGVADISQINTSYVSEILGCEDHNTAFY